MEQQASGFSRGSLTKVYSVLVSECGILPLRSVSFALTFDVALRQG